MSVTDNYDACVEIHTQSSETPIEAYNFITKKRRRKSYDCFKQKTMKALFINQLSRNREANGRAVDSRRKQKVETDFI